MHQLMRRAALAVVGAGLGVAAAAALAAAPSAAQTLTPVQESFILVWDDLDVTSDQEANDKIDGWGHLEDSTGATVGSSFLHCTMGDSPDADCTVSHVLYIGNHTGDIHFTFPGEYDATAGTIEIADGQDVDLIAGTGTGDFLGVRGSAFFGAVEGQPGRYTWSHQLWLPPNA